MIYPPPTTSTQNSLELRSVCAFTIYTFFSPFFLSFFFLFEKLINEGAAYAPRYTHEDQRITSLLLPLCGLQGWNSGWQAYTGTGLLSGLSVWRIASSFFHSLLSLLFWDYCLSCVSVSLCLWSVAMFLFCCLYHLYFCPLVHCMVCRMHVYEDRQRSPAL